VNTRMHKVLFVFRFVSFRFVFVDAILSMHKEKKVKWQTKKKNNNKIGGKYLIGVIEELFLFFLFVSSLFCNFYFFTLFCLLIFYSFIFLSSILFFFFFILRNKLLNVAPFVHTREGRTKHQRNDGHQFN